MAGRPRGDEGVGGLVGQNLVDGVDGAAGGAQRRLEAAGRHRGVGVELHHALVRRGVAHRFDVVHRMTQRDGFERRHRRVRRAPAIWNFSASSARSTARSRSGRSGWPGGVRCSRQAGWVIEQRGHWLQCTMRLSASETRQDATLALARRATAPARAFDDGALERAGLDGDILGEKPRQRDRAAAVGAEPQRRRAPAAPTGSRRWRGRTAADKASRRRVPRRRRLSSGRAASGRARQAVDRFAEPHAGPAEGRIVAGVHRLDDARAIRRYSAATAAPPASGSLRVTRSIAWMPLVPS